MLLGVWVNPYLGKGEFDFRLDSECTWRNYTACWWIMVNEYTRGTDDYKQMTGYWFGFTEQEAYADMGQKAIEWTEENKPGRQDMLDVIRRSVAETMAWFDSGEQNTPPVANADHYTVEQDTQLIVSAPGVLSNDTDADGDAITARVRTFPGHGSVSISQDGSLTYTPEAGFVGEDVFTYVADDGTEDSQPATVAITVTEAGGEPTDCSECEQALSDCQSKLTTLKNAIQAALDAAQ